MWFSLKKFASRAFIQLFAIFFGLGLFGAADFEISKGLIGEAHAQRFPWWDHYQPNRNYRYFHHRGHYYPRFHRRPLPRRIPRPHYGHWRPFLRYNPYQNYFFQRPYGDRVCKPTPQGTFCRDRVWYQMQHIGYVYSWDPRFGFVLRRVPWGTYWTFEWVSDWYRVYY